MITRAALFERFLGRQRELGSLVEAARDAKRRGRGDVILIGGESGVGKSRLLAEFRAVLEADRIPSAFVAADEGLARPFGMLLDVTDELAVSRDARVREALVRARDALASTSAGEERGDRTRRVAAFADALEAALERFGTLVIVFDDMHWSDLDSLDAARSLATLARRLPLVVVVAFRSDTDERSPQAASLGALARDGTVRITLGPLEARAVGALLGSVLPDAPPATLERINELSDGVPYVAEELVRDAIEARRRERPAGDVPLSLRASVLARVARLPAGGRDVLNRAAVFGRTVGYGELERLGVSRDAALETVRAARGLLLVEEDEREGEPGFRFRHALTREILYRELLVVERRAFHRAIADEVRASGGDHLAEIAFHLWRAADAGALAAGEAAGDAAAGVTAFAQAGTQYARAIEPASTPLDDVARIGRKALRALLAVGELDRLVELAENVAERLARGGRHAEALAVRAEHLEALARSSRVDEAARFADRVAVETTADLPAAVRFEIAYWTASIDRRRGRLDEAAAALDRAEAACDELDRSYTARLRNGRALLRMRRGDYEGARSDFALSVADEMLPLDVRGPALANLGLTSYRLLDLPEAIASSERSYDAYRRAGNLAGARRLAGNVALYAVATGDFALAKDAIARIEIASPSVPGTIAAELLLARATGGDGAVLSAVLARAERERDDYVLNACGRHMPAMAADAGEAATIVRRVLDAIERLDFATAATLVRFGSAADAERAERLARNPDDVETTPLNQGARELFAGAVALRHGRAAEALACGARAVDIFEPANLWLEAAEALLLAGRTAEALERLRAAGATAELERAGGAMPSPASSAPAAPLVSARENEVARLVASGLSNREVAEALGIGARTVETHLANAYKKLGISSRAELAAYFKRTA